MKLARPDLAAYALVALCVVAISALTFVGKGSPDVLQYLAVTALGVGGGVALQGTAGNSSSGAPTRPPAAVRAPAPAPALPLPVPLTAEPATGVFRAATHAP